MKKILFAMIAALAISTSTFAQDTTEVKRGPREFNTEEMAKQRTDEMVQKYGLNDDQAVKLLDLNTRFFQKMRPAGRMHRDGRGPRKDMRNGGDRHMNDSARADRQHQNARPGFNREEMKKTMDEYNAELKTIMTEDQYAAYEKDQKERRHNGQRGHGGPRHHGGPRQQGGDQM